MTVKNFIEAFFKGISQGLYGYNSTLVCLAIFYFFGLTIPSLIASFPGSILSVFIANIMRRTWRLLTFTAPFIISTFMVYGMLKVGIISLTSPFVISTWGVLLIKRRF